MQDVSIGLQRLPPGSLGGRLAAKENCGVARGPGKVWGAQQTTGDAQSQGVAAEVMAGELMEVTPPASQLGEEEEEESEREAAGPLPRLSWANSRELWAGMRAKDVYKTTPELDLCSRHPSILPTMRTILFDWLMEVCGARECVCVSAMCVV